MRGLVAFRVLGKRGKFLTVQRQECFDHLRQKGGVFDLQDQLSRLDGRKGRQSRVEDVKGTNGGPDVFIKGDADRAGVHDQRRPVVVRDQLGTQKLCRAFVVKFSTEFFLSGQKKPVIPVEDLLKFLSGERGGFFVDIAAPFGFPLQANALVTAIVDSDAPFLSEIHAHDLFPVG